MFNRWNGFIQPAFSERYTFSVEVNDGARLWIGDELMFDNFDAVRVLGSEELITTMDLLEEATQNPNVD